MRRNQSERVGSGISKQLRQSLRCLAISDRAPPMELRAAPEAFQLFSCK
jgi:hypothetical protein